MALDSFSSLSKSVKQKTFETTKPRSFQVTEENGDAGPSTDRNFDIFSIPSPFWPVWHKRFALDSKFHRDPGSISSPEESLSRKRLSVPGYCQGKKW